MKLYDNIGSLRLMNIKVIKDNKEIDSGTTILHV